MTTIDEAREAMYQLFSDGWTPTGFNFTLDNEKFKPTQNSPWARFVIRHAAATQDTLGRKGNRKFARFGSAITQIFVPDDAGTSQADDLIKTVQGIFEGERIPGTTIRFLDVIPQEIGAEGRWYQTNVNATFEYDETK